MNKIVFIARMPLVLSVLLGGAWAAVQAQDVAGVAGTPSGANQAGVPPGQSTPATVDSPAPASLAESVRVPVPIEQQPTNSPATQLSEVVVTATKRATPVRSIPGTVAVLKGADLEREGVQNLDQIVAQVPGVNIENTGTGGQASRVTIRGISAGINTNLTTGTLIGDTPFTDPFAPIVQLDANPFDMATVEILKGPQGTLFGGTGLNGMIRYVPNAPELDSFGVKYFGQFTSFPGNGGTGFSEGGVVNLPFANHTAAVRMMGFYRHDPGYVDDIGAGIPDANSISQDGFRAMLEWHPDHDWKLSFMGIEQRTYFNDLAFTDNPNGKLSRDDTPRQSPQTTSYALGNLGIQRSFSFADLISQTSVTEKRYDGFLDASRATAMGAVPDLAGAAIVRTESFIQELRLVSSPSQAPWKWLGGAYYYEERLGECDDIGAAEDLPSIASILALPGSVLATPCQSNAQKLAGELDVDQVKAQVKLRESALFGEVGRELGSYFDVSAGARAYHIMAGGPVSFSGALFTAENPSAPPVNDYGSDEEGLSPKASIIFHPTRDLRTYLTFSRGFRFGGPQIAASDPSESIPKAYRSDSLLNYELGVRTDGFQRTFRFDASAYHIDWKNPQVYQVTPDGLINYINNVGRVTGNGVEAELTYKPRFLHGLSLSSASSLNRTVTAVAFDDPSGKVIPTGSPFPLAPRWQTSTTLDYELLLRSWIVEASLRHTYLDTACNTIDCTAKVFGYQALDFNFAVSPHGDSYWPQLSLSLKNLTDSRGKSDFQTNTTPGATADTVTYIAPRMVVLRLSGRF